MGPGAHSPVGASSIKRALLCPYSVSHRGDIGEGEASVHAAKGTATHSLIEACMSQSKDAWEFIGQSFEGFEVDASMAKGAQVFLNAIRGAHPDRNQGNSGVEYRFHCPTIHAQFYGTSDFWFIDFEARQLHVWDYKNGAGVVVSVDENEQEMYYACGVLESKGFWEAVDEVHLHIVQPNAFLPGSGVSTWATTTEWLTEWLEDKLIPGIERALTSGEGQTGEHCRFCPLRFYACPFILKDMEELESMIEEAKGKPPEALTDAQVGRFLTLFANAKITATAAEQTAFARLTAGNEIPGFKLVKAKAFRAWKDGAEAEAKTEFGTEAYTEPKFKSPAQIEDLAKGRAFTARHAMKPEAGLTLAPDSDRRPAVSRDAAALFTKKG